MVKQFCDWKFHAYSLSLHGTSFTHEPRYFGNDEWGFAFYAYSSDKYELSVFPNGEFTGKPEDAFRASAMYLE